MFLYCKSYIPIDLTFLKELILIKEANQKSAIFVTIGIFLSKVSSKCLQWMSRFINDVYET